MPFSFRDYALAKLVNAWIRAVAALVIVAAFSWLTMAGGVPRIWAPASAIVLVAGWMADPLGSNAVWAIVVLIVPVFCVLWCVPVFRGARNVPFRSLVLLAITLALSALNVIMGFSYGVKWQGRQYTYGVIAFSVCLWVVLVALVWYARRRPTSVLNAAFHVSFFSWLAWYSLPTFGELP